MGNAAIIVAAGRGTRAGGDLPKQWQPLAGRRVADWTLDAMLRAGLSPIVVVLHPDDMELPLPAGVVRVVGGATRDASVRAGLAALDPAATANVLIHDVARPCVPATVIAEVVAALEAGAEAAAPGLPVTDALWYGDAGHVTGTAPRDGLFRAQTPQGFRLQPLLAAHAAHPGGAADDVEVARAAGIRVAITPGSEDNLKITHPGDFARAEAILRGTMDIRLGNGYDVHAFTEGDHVWLCGVKIPTTRPCWAIPTPMSACMR